ncbi:hypothetical protein D3C81_1771760 [compost metagenome]
MHHLGQLVAGRRFVGGDAHDGARWKGSQVVRVQGFEQGMGKLRIGVVEALGDPGSKQGNGLDQALDVRIFARFASDQQAPGRLRITAGKLARVLAEQAQLALVIR